jgi:hypothetical protein
MFIPRFFALLGSPAPVWHMASHNLSSSTVSGFAQVTAFGVGACIGNFVPIHLPLRPFRQT